MRLPSSGSSRARAPRRKASRPLGLEALEDRSLLSASTIDLSAYRVDTSHYDSSQILVQFRPAALAHGTPQALSGTAIGTKLTLVDGLYEVNLKSGTSVQKALAEYRADKQVIEADPNYSLLTNSVPNDPLYNQQQNLSNTGQNGGTAGDDIHFANAWSVTTGSYKTVVAVMDTGIDYNHPDLYQNIWINQAEIPKSRLAPSAGGTNPNGIQDYDGDGVITFADLNDPRNIGVGKITDVNGDGRIDAADILAPMVLDASGHDTGKGGWAYAGNTQDGDTAHPNDFIGWNFSNNTNNPFDDNGHGTQVSGIIGAKGNNGVGVAGVDWNISLMAVKFLNSNGNGSIGQFIDGLNYSVLHGAKISNNSWSGANNIQVLYDAIQNAQQHGQIFVASAGNDGQSNDVTPTYPASFDLDNIISVAATDGSDHLASFSNYGVNRVDLAAPGVNVLSTLPNNQYGAYNGTSQAAPEVTGVAALVWSEHPDWTYRQVISQILSTTDSVGALQGKVATGGILDAAKAVGFVGSTTTTQPATVPTTPVATRPVTTTTQPSTVHTTPKPAVLRVVSSEARGAVANTYDSLRITLSEAVNPATFNANTVSLIGPDGQSIAIQSFDILQGTGNRVIEIRFAEQTAVGNYFIHITTGLMSRAGGSLANDYRASYQLTPVYQLTNNTPSAIPYIGHAYDALRVAPNTGNGYSALNVDQSFTIHRVAVKLSLSNSADGDLFIHLEAPDGTDILLSNRQGGSGSDYTNTLFDDLAPGSVRQGTAPFNGAYQPESQLINLTGKNAQGTWKLWVENRGDTNTGGTITSWSLIFTGPDGNTEIAGRHDSTVAVNAPAAPAVPAPAAPAMTAPSLPSGELPPLTEDQPQQVTEAVVIVTPTAVAASASELATNSVPTTAPISHDNQVSLAFAANTRDTAPTPSATTPAVAPRSTDAVFIAANGVDRLAALHRQTQHGEKVDYTLADAEKTPNEESGGEEAQSVEA